MSEKSIIVHDFEIVIGRCYKVVHKKDSTAPSGMAAMGATKLPSDNIGNTVMARFVKDGVTGQGKYDTGFYKSSPCYKNDSKAEEKAKAAVKYILKPYEEANGTNLLDNTNFDFWDVLSIDLYEGRVFNTENIEELFALYIALLAYELCPVESVGNPKYSSAQYCVTDLDKVAANKNKSALDLMQAIKEMENLFEKDESGAKDVLRYVEVLTVMTDMEEETIKGLFFEWLNRDRENVTKFNKAVDILKTRRTKDVIPLYCKMMRLVGKGKSLRRDGGQYYYEGMLLGGDLKTAAKEVATNKELSEIKAALLTTE